MSRLILKPKLVLEGIDPSTLHGVHYSEGVLTIGCQAHKLAAWKCEGEAIIRRNYGYGDDSCDQPGCGVCLNREKRNAAMVRKYLPRLTRLIEHIERAEAALKQSLRPQTKST